VTDRGKGAWRQAVPAGGDELGQGGSGVGEKIKAARRLSNRGADLLRAGKAQEALLLLKRAYEALPDDVPTAINLGGAYVLNKQYKKAIPVLERAREREPGNEMVWINLGAAYLGNPILAQDEQQCQAIAAFERALEINPAATNVHYSLGLIHRDRGEVDRAIRRFRQAVQVNPLDRHARRALERLEHPDAQTE
jgi:tetratricopeptide (TPR) repeat protein